MFARKQPAALRLKLEEVNQNLKTFNILFTTNFVMIQLERDRKIGHHLQEQIYIERKLELLTALKKLNETLSFNELEFLDAHSTDAMTNFEAASSELSTYVIVCE